jgi:hypothetical protein
MRNPILDIFHNLYGILFCFYALYESYPIITENLDTYHYMTNYNKIFYQASLYFLVSGLINIYDKNNLFLLHHIICWSGLYYGTIYGTKELIYWVGLNFLSEISTIFLSTGIILKALSNYFKVNPMIDVVLKIIFLISYGLVRIIYLLPINIKFLLTYHFYGWFGFLLHLGSWFMVGLNIYWFMEILKKIYKTIFNKNFLGINIKPE